LTGTFVNRNTAATFFGTVMILWLVRLLRELDRRVPKSATGIRDFGAALLDAPPRALTIALGGTFLAFAALLLTRSRAGIILTLGCSFVAALLTLRGRVSSRAGALTGIGAGVVIAAFLVEFLGGAVAGRIGGQGLVDEGRLASYASSLAIIRDNPWLGTGLGSFRDIFPAYRSPDISTFGLWDRAHNTPLEIAVELGIPAGGAIVALWLLGLGRLLWGALTRRRDVDVPIAAFGIGLLGSLHALVDFSPQVPGFVVPWLVLLGCGLAQSVRTVGAEEPVPGRAAPAAAAVA
ncbi:MAG: O-antigen ligase protein, partial [Enterovirga sp.]|nr:O-antigen ligase protein [Enterovirga sp.]